MKSKAIIFSEAKKVKLGHIDVPEPADDQLIVKTVYSGVSTGTETRVLKGGQAGAEFPLIPGYENVGEVVAVGRGCRLEKGEIVFHAGSSFTGAYQKCWGAHLELALICEGDAFPVPEGLDPTEAVHTKVGAIALHGVKRADVTAEDTVAVVGLGLIGHWAAQCARARGARVIGIDRDKERLEMARAAGIESLVDASSENVKEKVDSYSGGKVTVAMDVTGVPHTIMETARLVRAMPWSPPFPASARLVILGSYTEPIILNYDPLFMTEIDILFSRDTRPDDISDMLNLLAQRKVNPGALSTRFFDVDDAPEAYRQMLEGKIMRIAFKW